MILLSICMNLTVIDFVWRYGKKKISVENHENDRSVIFRELFGLDLAAAGLLLLFTAPEVTFLFFPVHSYGKGIRNIQQQQLGP